ncbi:F-box domain-containing protein [Favolaschia claudopus]|uniref:F-box domain-containing protein n=1 Tax=Favolaschia claudopus TaxID=2862362 RepID=A0AAV9ZGA4_9AGAR
MMSDSNPIAALLLPFELVSAIFILCLPLRRRVKPHPNRTPLNLASVCAQWRAVALAIPELWTSIYLTFSGQDAYDGIPVLFGCIESIDLEDHAAALMDLWFTRAAGHPISISLTCAKHHSLPKRVLETLVKYRDQWGRIELRVSSSDFLAFNEVTGPFSSLTSLRIEVIDFLPRSPLLAVSALETSERLTSYELSDGGNNPVTPDTLVRVPRTLVAAKISCQQSFAWSQNGFGAMDIGGFFSPLLEHLHHLRHLDVSIGHHGPRPDAKRLHASLITLRLGHDNLLPFLSIPTLQHLHTYLTSAIYLMSFIQHSQCRLISLSVSLYWLTKGAWVSCLAALPELETLLITVIDHSAVQRCEVLLDDPELVPRLRSLVLKEEYTLVPRFDQWLALLGSRSGIRHALLHVWPRHAHERRCMSPAPPEVESGLERLARGGMDVRLITPRYQYPWNAEELDPVGDLDPKPDGPLLDLRPYHFSPF